MVNFVVLMLKIFVGILCLLALILIMPVRYTAKIKNLNYVFFRIGGLFGIINFQFETDKQFKFRIAGINLLSILKKKASPDTPEKIQKSKLGSFVDKKISSLHKKILPDKNKFDSIMPIIKPTLVFVKDVVKKIRPYLIKITGQIGLENPADTAWLSQIINFLAYTFHIKQNVQYDFQNKIFNLEIELYGKTCALHFLLIVIKYLRNEHVFSLVKNNFISNEV